MQKIDVFLKTYKLDSESIKNIQRWIFLFSQKLKYNIKLIIPENCNNLIIDPVLKNIEVCNDIKINDTIESEYVLFYNKIKMGKNPGIANLTCYKNAKTSFFWNIDADDTYFTLNSLDDNKLLDKLEEIENIAINNNYYATSLDFYRIFNYHSAKWSDHWSFGICFMKNDLKTINEALPEIEIYDRGFGINSDHIFDTIRRYNKIKIVTFVIKNSRLIHPTNDFRSALHLYNTNDKETYYNGFKNINNYYEHVDRDYIII